MNTNVLHNRIKRIFLFLLMTTVLLNFFMPGVAGIIFLDPGGGAGTPPDETPPAQITDLTIDSWMYTEIEISWDESLAHDFYCYKIYRNGVLKNTIDTKSDTTYVDTGLLPGSTYTYKVSAEDTSSNEGEKSTAVSKTLPIPPVNALKLCDFSSVDFGNPYTWTSDYITWLNEFQISQAVTGYFPGNVMGASFQPIAYKYDTFKQEYELSYLLAVRGETNIGGGPLGNSFPAPWLDDNFESFNIPAPMFIKKTGIRTTLLPNDGNIALLNPTTHLSIKDATSASLLGTYTPEIGAVTVENLIADGQFKDLYNSQLWWNTFGNGAHGTIAFGAYGHVDDGVALVNNDDGILSVYSDSITANVQEEGNVLVNYWGKRSSSDVGNEVGVKLIITYFDDSTLCVFPEELQMTHRDNIWHNYQYSVPSYGDIQSIVIKLENNELGSAYFDQIYVTTGWWECNEVGDWNYGTFADTYSEFLNQMELALTVAEYKYLAGMAIEDAGFISEATGWGWLGKLGDVTGYFLNIINVDIPNFILLGSEPNDYSCYWEYIHHSTDENGNFNYAFGVDDLMRVNFDIDPSDFTRHYGNIQLLIEIDLTWGYCGDPMYLDEVSWDDNVESTTLQFLIDLTNMNW